MTFITMSNRQLSHGQNYQNNSPKIAGKETLKGLFFLPINSAKFAI